MSLWQDIPRAAKVGAIFGLIPFVVSFTSTQTSSGGGITACSHMDIAALVGGAIALIAGVAAFLPKRDAMGPVQSASMGIRLGSGLVVAALGAFQILRGLGMVGGPCA